MHSRYLFLLLFITGYTFAQSAKQTNSLLWEISGNNLSKPSYLYGTMHVSNKIAFRLDDVFYQALDNAEYVALESDPNLWLDYYLKSSNSIDFSNIYSSGFYKENFVPEAPKLQNVAGILGFDTEMINNVLYRTSLFSTNFQEETYLDMFIYQACQKFNKKFVPLEDIEESDNLVKKSQNEMTKDQPDAWLMKSLLKDSYNNLLENAYRERNIYLIDSLQQGYYTQNYLKYMLYERNKIMVKGISETVQKGSTFIGIGAAHLGGENGVIQLLQSLGYTVKPLLSEKTNIAQKLKEKFENTFTVRPYVRDTISGGFMSVELPNKLYNFGSFKGLNFYASPDLTNGAYFTAFRISTYPYLSNSTNLGLEQLEDMFFESIPGSIISKKKIYNGSYPGVDVVNKLKNGDYQRYQIFKTPLEIVILKLSGKKEFTLNNGGQIFKTIKFRNRSDNAWVNLSNAPGSFSVSVPNEYAFYNGEKAGKKTIQAYDNVTGASYLLERCTLNDLNYIEEDNFELEFIQKKFYESLKLTPVFDPVKLENGLPALTSSAKLDTLPNAGNLHIKTLLKKGDYYLLASFNASDEDTGRFFNSLTLNEPEYKDVFEAVKDTALYFSSVSNVKASPENALTKLVNSGYKHKSEDLEENPKFVTYKNNNDELISVSLRKLNDYTMFENTDSLWNSFYMEKYRYPSLVKKVLLRTPLANGVSTQELLLTDTLSNRAIYLKSVLKNGALYELKTVTDTIHKPSRFVKEFYDNFTPNDTVIGVSPFEDKTALYFEKLRANDSLINGTLYHLNFTEKHLDSLMHFVTDFDFPDDKKSIRTQLIYRISEIEDKRVKPFLKKLYENSYADSATQEYILNLLAEDLTEDSVKEIIELLTNDFPVNIQDYSFFYNFRELPISKEFFPQLLDYAFIEEYKYPVYILLSDLVRSKSVSPKIYKRMVPQLLNETKIEFKRQLSSDNQSYEEYDEYEYEFDYSQSLLPEYVTLLYAYRNTKKVADFLDRLEQIKNDDFKMDYLIIKKQFGEAVEANDFLPFAEDVTTRENLFYKLSQYKLINLFPKDYFSQDSLNVTAFYGGNDYNTEINQNQLLGKYRVTNKKGTFNVYIYKSTTKDYDDDETQSLVAIGVKEGKEITADFDFTMNRKYKTYDTEEKQIKDLLEEIEYIGRERVGKQRNVPNNYLSDYDY